MSTKTVNFPRPTAGDFYNTTRKRVHDYFKEKGISKHANAAMVFKTFAMLSIYFVPYFLMITGVFVNTWAIYACWAVMGLGMAGIGLSVMHDANHGAYSKNRTVNTIIGQVIWFVGGSSVNWKIQHNVLHHSFTNVDHMDEDLEAIPILRFTPHKKLMKIHRFQFIYAWFFYGLMTIMWATVKDFNQLNRYKRKDLIKTQKKSYNMLLTELIVVKSIYYVLFLAIPLLFVPFAWWQIVLGFLMMHWIAGFILAAIFQPAHVTPDAAFPLPDDQGNMENKWAIHQLMTTMNFAPKSRLFSWYVGGLNYQVEHHLFPNVCHIHYKRISEIVKKTAEEFNLPYYSKPTFLGALQAHTALLKQLGRA
ncbi:MAG: linoleoyl-CoA desaturase [Bacteroidia bacterium]|jgi:linoleoyl-CoA desaturase